MWLRKLGETLLASDSEDDDDSGRESLSEGLGLDRLFGTACRFMESANDAVFNGAVGDLLAPESQIATKKRFTVAVVGSASAPHEHLCVPLGKWIAESGFNLLTNGDTGVAAEVSRAFCKTVGRAGSSIAVLPAYKPPQAPHGWIDVPIQTQLQQTGADSGSINHTLALSSDVLVTLPGSMEEACCARLAVKYHKPVVLYLGVDPMARVVGLDLKLPVARTVNEVVDFLRSELSEQSLETKNMHVTGEASVDVEDDSPRVPLPKEMLQTSRQNAWTQTVPETQFSKEGKELKKVSAASELGEFELIEKP